MFGFETKKGRDGRVIHVVTNRKQYADPFVYQVQKTQVQTLQHLWGKISPELTITLGQSKKRPIEKIGSLCWREITKHISNIRKKKSVEPNILLSFKTVTGSLLKNHQFILNHPPTLARQWKLISNKILLVQEKRNQET